MAETAVTLLLNFLSSLSREVIEQIRDELESARAFLRVADSHEDTDEEMLIWVKQVRDVVYDMEDVLEEFALSVQHRPPSRVSFCFLECRLFRFLNRLKARHGIASTMKEIKSRAKSISERRQRYRQLCIGDAGISNGSCNWKDHRGDALLLDEAKLVGIHKAKSHLIDVATNNDPARKAISVVGMGGMEKITFMTKVYRDLKVRKYFYAHVWVTISRSFDQLELFKDIVKELYGKIGESPPQDLIR